MKFFFSSTRYSLYQLWHSSMLTTNESFLYLIAPTKYSILFAFIIIHWTIVSIQEIKEIWCHEKPKGTWKSIHTMTARHLCFSYVHFSRITWFTAKNNSVSYGDIMHDLLRFGNVQFTYTRSIERRESPSTVKLRLEPALYGFFCVGTAVRVWK